MGAGGSPRRRGTSDSASRVRRGGGRTGCRVAFPGYFMIGVGLARSSTISFRNAPEEMWGLASWADTSHIRSEEISMGGNRTLLTATRIIAIGEETSRRNRQDRGI